MAAAELDCELLLQLCFALLHCCWQTMAPMGLFDDLRDFIGRGEHFGVFHGDHPSFVHHRVPPVPRGPRCQPSLANAAMMRFCSPLPMRAVSMCSALRATSLTVTRVRVSMCSLMVSSQTSDS